MKSNVYCPYCQAKMVEYPYEFNRGLAICLFKLWRAGKPSLVRNLGLTTSQYVNFQKLAYWNLIQRTAIHQAEGEVINPRLWEISELGYKFIRNQAGVQERVWTYRKKVLRHEGNLIYFSSRLPEEYKQFEDYLENCVPHYNPSGEQTSLF